MARRPTLIKKQAKVVKKTRSEQYIINKKYLGDEPIFTSNPVTDIQHSKNLYWYGSMCSQEDAKEYLVDYLYNCGRDSDAKKVNSIHKNWIPSTAAWVARMIGRGAVFSLDTKEFLEDRIQECLQRDYSKARMEVESQDGGETKPEQKPSQKPSVQDRMKVKLNDFITELEGIIDDFHNAGYTSSFSMYEHLKANEIPPVQANRIIEFYDPQLCEIEDAYNKTDPDIVEGYAGYSPKNLEKLYDFYVMIVEDAQRYAQNEKKARKPRTPKPVSAEKKLKDFKFMPAYDPLKLKSIRPEQVLGASELWTFSTKYNQLTVFRMASPAGLDVHRTAITNFDEATSKTKKLKAKDVNNVLSQVLTGGKVAMRNMMANIKGSDQKLQERMNENTILLRASPK